MSRPDPPYPGGFPAILAQMDGRRGALDFAPGEGLPPLDADLAALSRQIVPPADRDPLLQDGSRSGHARKTRDLRREFTGGSELCCLHGLLVAHLRKRDQPPHAAALFRRLWAEQSGHLLAHLNQRWLVSAVTTFGDHPGSAVQRSVGLSLTVLFGMTKLYEAERLYSGLPPDRPFPLDGKVRGALPMQMDPYSLTSGGLDVNLLGRLWTEAAQDAVIRPLAHHLLDLLIEDERTVLRRLMTMRTRKARRDARAGPAKPARAAAPVAANPRGRDPATLRWGLVATVKAPVAQIARFAAHHLELGAHALHIYLDDPDPATVALLSRHPRLHVTACDAAWWDATGKVRPDAHQLRQAHNATRTLRAAADDLDWLGHIDADEFLLPDAPLATTLAALPDEAALARVLPVEALARDTGLPRHFKLTHKAAGQPKAVTQDIYPTFGLHLYGGFLSHHSGKVFARPGIPDTRLGIHTLRYKGEEAANAVTLPGIWLAHFHAPTWEHFRSHFEFRRTLGSYRDRHDTDQLGLSDILTFLAEEDGDSGLRAFFDEICADTPELRAKLAAHGMLLTRTLDLDASVRRVFGSLP